MLKRISPDRAHEIQRRVDRIMRLFDRVPATPSPRRSCGASSTTSRASTAHGQAQRRGALKR
jgi:hypothetical protein